MEKSIFVSLDLNGKTRFVGRLWSRSRKEKESATFEYDPTWLKQSNRFSIDPLLKLDPGPFHTPDTKRIFGALSDSAPDRWGRALMRRAEKFEAESENRSSRTLNEIDYLLRVDDESRQGALRFSEFENGPYLNCNSITKIPPLIQLPKLLSAAWKVSADTNTDADIRLLLAPGSSLGGARPKASIRDAKGQLAIAKFPHKHDLFGQVEWESLALSIAAQSGMEIPTWKIVKVATKHVLILHRFDRRGNLRIPFLSAMSMLEANDGEDHSYLEIADAIRQKSGAPKADLHSLWRRLVFNILISNNDDHLRNHGFLYDSKQGWRLSPAYDLNPTPTDIKPRILTTLIDENDGTASLDLALKVSPYFELKLKEAKAIAAQVGIAVSKWRTKAKGLKISPKEINRMASAFEHKDLELALKLNQSTQ